MDVNLLRCEVSTFPELQVESDKERFYLTLLRIVLEEMLSWTSTLNLLKAALCCLMLFLHQWKVV